MNDGPTALPCTDICFAASRWLPFVWPLLWSERQAEEENVGRGKRVGTANYRRRRRLWFGVARELFADWQGKGSTLALDDGNQATKKLPMAIVEPSGSDEVGSE
jgi:hypothetical protein